MLQQQHNRCKICNKELYKPHIDHNHKTGKIRGLLCYKCNHAMGLLEENITSSCRMIEYLIQDQTGMEASYETRSY
jgi:hypothetical protein